MSANSVARSLSDNAETQTMIEEDLTRHGFSDDECQTVLGKVETFLQGLEAGGGSRDEAAILRAAQMAADDVNALRDARVAGGTLPTVTHETAAPLPQIHIAEPTLPVYTWDTLMQMDFPPERFLIEGLVPQDGFTILSGQRGARKTWVLAHGCLCVATERKFLSHFPVKPGRVLILALEGGLREHHRRLAALGRDLKSIPLFTYEGTLRTGDEEERTRIANTIRAYRPDLIALDHLRAAFPGDEFDSERAAKIAIFIRQMQDVHPATWIVIGHLGKDKTRGVRGSIAIEDAADSIISVEKVPDSRGLLTHEKLRSGTELRPFEFKFSGPEAPGGADLVHAGERGATERDEKRYRVYEALLKLGTDGTKREAIDKETGLSKSVVKEYLAELEDRGLARRTGDGPSTLWWPVRGKAVADYE